MTVDPAFWRGRRVLLTGNTGFKGAWLALWLTELGAELHGFSAAPLAGRSLHEQARLDEIVPWTRADVRDAAAVRSALQNPITVTRSMTASGHGAWPPGHCPKGCLGNQGG